MAELTLSFKPNRTKRRQRALAKQRKAGKVNRRGSQVKAALNYCLERGERVQEMEFAILTCPDASLAYARKIIKGRWPEGERIILTKPENARIYLEFVANMSHIGLDGKPKV